MVQKNVELQLQALRLIQQQFPDILAPGAEHPPPTHTEPSVKQSGTDEDAIMAEVMRRSKEEYEAQQKLSSNADKELEAAILKSQEAEKKRLV